MAVSPRSTRVLAAEDDLRPLLVDTARAVQSALDGVHGAGVTLLVGGDLVYGCANGFATTIDTVQYRLMQGPCVDATASGVVVRSDDIGPAERRWQEFTSEAAALALRSVVSVPLRANDVVIGSLNLYSRERRGLDELDDTAARRAGEVITPGVRNARLIAVAARNSALLRGPAVDGRPR